MCIGIPVRLCAVDGAVGKADDGAGGSVVLDLSLTPEAAAGDWVLSFLGAARRRLDAEEAALILDALAAVAAVARGEACDDAFADLAGRAPALPPHLEAARAAGLKEA